jgi:hypothetical protein
MPLLYPRPPRYILVLTAAIALTIASYHSLSPGQHTRLRSILSGHHAPSAWLSDQGYIRFNNSEKWNTHYDVAKSDAAGFTCDEETVLSSGRIVCRNRLEVMAGLAANVQAQDKRMIAQAGAGDSSGAVGFEDDEATFTDSYEALSGIAGKRLLIVGDSVDRNWITQLVDIAYPSSFYTNLFLAAPNNPQTWIATHTAQDPSAATRQGISAPSKFKHECGVAIFPIAPRPSLSTSAEELAKSFTPHYTAEYRRNPHHFRIDFAFVMGILFEGKSASMPANTTDRMAIWKDLVGGDVGDRWDLAGYQQRRFIQYLADDDPDISMEWLDEYTDAYERFIGQLRLTYGQHVPIYIRLTHDTAPANMRYIQDIPADIMAKINQNTVTFRPLRLKQIRQAQLNVARATGSGVQPFARRFDGVAAYTFDGTHPDVASNMVHVETIFRQLASP